MGLLLDKFYPCGKVLQGDYDGNYVYCWNKDTFKIYSENVIEFSKIMGLEKRMESLYCSAIITCDTVENYEIISENQTNADAGTVARATLLFGVGAGLLASQMGKDSHHMIGIEFIDGRKSLIRFNSSGYDLFVSAIAYNLKYKQEERRKIKEKEEAFLKECERQQVAQKELEQQNEQWLQEFQHRQQEKNEESNKMITMRIKNISADNHSAFSAVKIIRFELNCSLKEAREFLENSSPIECRQDTALRLMEQLDGTGYEIFFDELAQSENVVETPVTQQEVATPRNEFADNLGLIKQLKELFDIGAITQEEFDAKKKQLLGL